MGWMANILLKNKNIKKIYVLSAPLAKIFGVDFQRRRWKILGCILTAAGEIFWGVFSAPQAKIFVMYSYRRRRKFLGYFVSASGANLWGVFLAPWEKYIGVNFQRIFILVFFQRGENFWGVLSRAKKKMVRAPEAQNLGVFFQHPRPKCVGVFCAAGENFSVFSFEIFMFSLFLSR